MYRGRNRRKAAIGENSETTSAPPDRFTRLTRRLVSHLRDHPLRDVAETFNEAIRLDRSRVGIAGIKWAFAKVDRFDLFLDLLLSEGADAGFGLALVAEAFVLGSTLNRTAQVQEMVRGSSGPRFDLRQLRLPQKSGSTTDDLTPRLRALKYPDLPDIESPGDSWSLTRKRSPTVWSSAGKRSIIFIATADAPKCRAMFGSGARASLFALII